MPAYRPTSVEVIVLARGPDAFLGVGGTGVGAFFLAEKIGLNWSSRRW